MRHLAAWRDAPFHYPSDFICRKSAERLDSMANKPSDPGSESVRRLHSRYLVLYPVKVTLKKIKN